MALEKHQNLGETPLSMAPRHGGNLSQVSQVCPINLLLRKTSPPPMLVVEAAEATFGRGNAVGPHVLAKKVGGEGWWVQTLAL